MLQKPVTTDYMSVNLANDKALRVRLALVRLVLMDIDGTLVTGRADTLNNVLTQLKRLRARSIRFSIATGRTLTGAKKVLDSLQSTHAKLPAMIAYNGGVIAVPEPQSIIERNVIASENVVAILEALSAAKVDTLVYTCEAELDLSPVERVISFKRGSSSRTDFNGMKIEYRRTGHLSDVQNVIAILGVASSREDAERLTYELGSSLSAVARITTSGGQFIEIAAAHTGKLVGMHRLCQILDIPTESVMCIGDSYNDKDMLEGAGVGVAVANAPDEVKAAARYVCQNTGAEGVVEALRMLIDAQRLSTLMVKAGLDR
jgi:Cof subfamily protein (haloacid dehalogenase superfamily)